MKKETTIRPVAYLPSTTVLADFNRMVAEVSDVGVLPDDTTVGGAFDVWSEQLKSGQTAWIYSLGRFHSISELMTYHEAIQRRGVALRSIKEPWFNDPAVSGVELLGHLFRLGEVMHQQLPPAAVCQRGKVRGGLTAKVVRAVELRTTGKLSVVAACRMAGCGVNAYYRYLKAKEQVV